MAERLFSYKMTHDTGFAPNPWWNYLTLATCKPKIREVKQPGDWIAGFTSMALCGERVGRERLVFVMRVAEKVSIADYFGDDRFRQKIPRSGSRDRRLLLGDNIYKPLKQHPRSDGDFLQVDDLCHNADNRHDDLSGKYVLVATEFAYFGSEAIKVPDAVRPDIPSGQSAHGSRTHDEGRLLNFIAYVRQQTGLDGCVLGAPHSWPVGDGGRERSPGKCAAPKMEPRPLRVSDVASPKPRC